MTVKMAVDFKARERIKSELDRTFLVEASAGSGKTQSLVDRLVALIYSGRATINQIAAVTFTRKATAELRSRFQVELEKRFAAENEPEIKMRLCQGLDRLEQIFIGTIHSFCASLLRERPVESGVDPEFEEMDESEDVFFRSICWHEFLEKARLENPDLLAGLDRAGLSAPDLAGAFDQVSIYPEAGWAEGRKDAPESEEFLKLLRLFLEDLSSVISADEENVPRDLRKLIDRILLRLDKLDHAELPILMTTYSLLDKEFDKKNSSKKSKSQTDLALTKFLDFREQVVIPVLKHWREFRHSAALEFLKPAVDYYARRRAEMSKLNFTDQLMKAANLLKNYPEVRSYFKARYRYILVDEFQDTDPLQAEILFYLAGKDVGETDWTKLELENGTLFLVGDPKQSIYRFRRADIDIYSLVKKKIIACGGEVLHLSANFRSSPHLIDKLNSIFSQELIFPAESNTYQAGFSPLVAARKTPDVSVKFKGRFSPGCGQNKSLKPQIHLAKFLIPKVAYHKGETIAELDALQVAGFVDYSLAGHLLICDMNGKMRPCQPGDFLVLFRYKKHMDIYAREFENLGLPCEIFGSEAFAESLEIQEIVKVLRLLADPSNPVLLVSVLRGLFFGLSDQELLDYKEDGGTFSLVHRPASPGSSRHLKIRRAMSQIYSWQAWAVYEPASVVLEKLIEETGLLVALSSEELGHTRCGNVLKLVEILRDYEIKKAASFRQTVEYLEKWIDFGMAEEMNILPRDRNVVRLMNLHKAKGLEAPVVILANPKGSSIREPEAHVERQDKTIAYYCFRKKPAGKEMKKELLTQPLDWDAKLEEEKKYLEAEENRLMYVAATRARELLVVSVYEHDLGSAKSWSVIDDWIRHNESLVPELKIKGFSSASSASKSEADLTDEAIRKRAVEVNVRKGRAVQATYFLESVTGLSSSDRRYPAQPGSEGGLKWGAAAHLLLNRLGRDWPVRRYSEDDLLLAAHNALISVDGNPLEAQALVNLVTAVINSEFWLRAMAAEKSLFEVPFSILIKSREPEYEALTKRVGFFKKAGEKIIDIRSGAPFILTGVIDLVFKEKDGWVVADYKTDVIAGQPDGTPAGVYKKELVGFYRPQVEIYSRYWQKITGEKVKESGLYFTFLKEWVPLKLSFS